MTTHGFPFHFEDTTGTISGPTDFLDIYDRPPFLRLVPSQSQCAVQSRSHKLPQGDEGTTLSIFELGARTFVNPRRHHGTPPLAVIDIDSHLRGSIKFRANIAMPIEKWLRKSTIFGSTLTREFKGSDGMTYQWSFRTVSGHEWACIQLGTNYLVAHYNLKSSKEPRYKISGNVFTVYERWVHLSVELLASLVIMRHIHSYTYPN